MTSDLIVTMPTTRPEGSTTGPPLLPGSIGIASWIMRRSSTSRTPDTTPFTTLNCRPCGLPTVITGRPSGSVSESPRGRGTSGCAGGLIRRMARSIARSDAVTSVTACREPSANCTASGLASPATCRFVAISPSASTTNPEPSPCCRPSRPSNITTTTDGRTRLASSSTDVNAAGCSASGWARAMPTGGAMQATAPQMMRTRADECHRRTCAAMEPILSREGSSLYHTRLRSAASPTGAGACRLAIAHPVDGRRCRSASLTCIDRPAARRSACAETGDETRGPPDASSFETPPTPSGMPS